MKNVFEFSSPANITHYTRCRKNDVSPADEDEAEVNDGYGDYDDDNDGAKGTNDPKKSPNVKLNAAPFAM